MPSELIKLFSDLSGAGVAIAGVAVFIWALTTNRIYTGGRVADLKEYHKKDVEHATELLEDAKEEIAQTNEALAEAKRDALYWRGRALGGQNDYQGENTWPSKSEGHQIRRTPRIRGRKVTPK